MVLVLPSWYDYNYDYDYDYDYNYDYDYDYKYNKIWKTSCFLLNANVRCKDPNVVAKSGIIISVTVIICAIIIFAVFLKRRRAERRRSHSILRKQDSREMTLMMEREVTSVPVSILTMYT